jgi:hypothetical protein
MDEEHPGAFLQLMQFETAFVGELPGRREVRAFGLRGHKAYAEYAKEFDAYEAQRAAAAK